MAFLSSHPPPNYPFSKAQGPRQANPKCLLQSPSWACAARPWDLCPCHLCQEVDPMISKDPAALEFTVPSRPVSWGPLPGGRETEASMPCPPGPGPAPKYLFRAVHAVPGFVLQEVLLPKVTFPAFGTLEGFLPSVFPTGRSHGGVGAERTCHPPSPRPPPAPLLTVLCSAAEEDWTWANA